MLKWSKTRGTCSKSNDQNLWLSRMLFMCLLLFLVVVKHNTILSIHTKNKKRLVYSGVSLDRGEQDAHNGEEFISNRSIITWEDCIYFVCLKCLCWKHPQMADALITYWIAGHLLDCSHAQNVYMGFSGIWSVACMLAFVLNCNKWFRLEHWFVLVQPWIV